MSFKITAESDLWESRVLRITLDTKYMIIWYHVVINLFTQKYLSSPWARSDPKLDFKITHGILRVFINVLY
jgi:hypothetical protein